MKWRILYCGFCDCQWSVVLSLDVVWRAGMWWQRGCPVSDRTLWWRWRWCRFAWWTFVLMRLSTETLNWRWVLCGPSFCTFRSVRAFLHLGLSNVSEMTVLYRVGRKTLTHSIRSVCPPQSTCSVHLSVCPAWVTTQYGCPVGSSDLTEVYPVWQRNFFLKV